MNTIKLNISFDNNMVSLEDIKDAIRNDAIITDLLEKGAMYIELTDDIKYSRYEKDYTSRYVVDPNEFVAKIITIDIDNLTADIVLVDSACINSLTNVSEVQPELLRLKPRMLGSYNDKKHRYDIVRLITLDLALGVPDQVIYTRTTTGGKDYEIIK